MVRMNTVWDRTTEVMSGRFGMLATIAGLLNLLPTAAQAAYASYVATPAAAAGGAAMAMGAAPLIGLALIVCAIWCNLSLVAAASDPNIHGAGHAIGIGLGRLPLGLGLTLLLGLAFAILLAPGFLILGLGALDWTAMQPGALASAVTPGSALGFLAYLVALLVVGVWASSRLILLNPVIVNERRGVASLARSFQLTRGLALRIVGVLILFGVVFVVLSFAVQAVTGIVFRLAFGATGTAAFLTALASALVGAGFTIVLATFTAQLYRSVTGEGAVETSA